MGRIPLLLFCLVPCASWQAIALAWNAPRFSPVATPRRSAAFASRTLRHSVARTNCHVRSFASPQLGSQRDGDDNDKEQNEKNKDDGQAFVDWDGIGALRSGGSGSGSSSVNANAGIVVIPKEIQKIDRSMQDRDEKSSTDRTTERSSSRPTSGQTTGTNVPVVGTSSGQSAVDPPVFSRKFTGGGASLFAESSRSSSFSSSTSTRSNAAPGANAGSARSSSMRDEMMEREFNLAGLFERTLPLQAAFIAFALVFVIYVSMQEPAPRIPIEMMDTAVDESLLPDFWSQFQGGSGDRVDVEEIGKVSSESVFL